MNDKELWELMSIICEGQDSEQRRKVEQYITDLQKEIDRLGKLFYERNEENIRLKERLSFYESDDDTVLMSKEKWEEVKQELQIEKETNKELLSTGADLENKLYEEQDKNKRLNNIINELKAILESKGYETYIPVLERSDKE